MKHIGHKLENTTNVITVETFLEKRKKREKEEEDKKIQEAKRRVYKACDELNW